MRVVVLAVSGGLMLIIVKSEREVDETPDGRRALSPDLKRFRT